MGDVIDIFDPQSTKLAWNDHDGCRRLKPITADERDRMRGWPATMSWKEKLDPRSGVLLCSVASNPTNAAIILRHDLRWRCSYTDAEGETRTRPLLAIDEMASQISTRALPPWHEYEPSAKSGWWDSDSDPTRMADWLYRSYGMVLTHTGVHQVVLQVAQDETFHPVRDWLHGLQHDGEPRVHTFFARYFGCPDTVYTQAASRIFLVGLVARGLVPGCKHDSVVVLEGGQGLRKSMACRTIAGAHWFAEATSEIGTKDSQLAMHGRWLLEMPELAGFGRSQIEAIKAFFSRPSDWVRPPYGKSVVEMRRSSAVIATTNDSQYLRDKTGNRRYLPILCGAKIDIDGLAADREQIFAEAVALYQAGAQWWAEPHELAAAAIQTEKRETVDPWEDLVLPWLSVPISTPEGLKVRGHAGVTTKDVLTFLEVPAERRGPESAVRIGTMLRHMGLVVTRPNNAQHMRECKQNGVTYSRVRVYRWLSDAEKAESLDGQEPDQ